MAKKMPARCKCLQLVNKALEKDGCKLKTGLAMNLDTGEGRIEGPYIVVERIDGKVLRGKSKLPAIICTYCPFCGKFINR